MDEIKKRRQSDTSFTTKSLQYLSLICIISGFTTNFVHAFNEFDGFCIFATLLGSSAFLSQILSIGLYQLSRLHYCFANEQIHSKQGYSGWVFNMMTLIGIVCAINFEIIFLFNRGSLCATCGFTSNFEFYFIETQIFSLETWLLWSWWLAMCIIFLSLDVTTLLLYHRKIQAIRDRIKEKSELVYKRILSILYKIFILTLFYQITAVTAVLINFICVWLLTDTTWIRNILNNLWTIIITIAMCISMYLMMDHNKSEYIKFLRIIIKLKLNWICCCCRDIATEQLMELDVILNLQEVVNTKKLNETEFNTMDHSLPQTPKDLQVETSEVTITYQQSTDL